MNITIRKLKLHTRFLLTLVMVLVGNVLSNQAFSQAISVNQAITTQQVQDYVQNVLLGSCVTASNITYSGVPRAAGTFSGAGTVLGLQGGVLLTSGQAGIAVGPDNANSSGFGNGGAGDPDLRILASNFQTYDAAILEFDFVPQSDTLRFNYIFGSEEYPEYVNSGYNDVFGFFISGPGIAGPFSGGAVNIALIPGTTLPVAIDNVNNGYSATEPSIGPCENCAYYVDNSNGPAVQYDGHTTVLTAQIVVTSCQSYHIKIAVADAGDGALDSGVFLEGGSFSASGEEAVTMEAVAGVTGIYEGCDIGSFVFSRLPGASNSSPLTVGYLVSGTATPGVDYTALPGSVTIPAGQNSAVVNIEGILDYTTEGTETVVLNLAGGGCSCTPPPTVSMDILDNDIPLALSTTGTTTICHGESANLTANTSGSIMPYVSGWDNSVPAGNNVSVSPTQTTTYTFTLTDACSGQSLTSSETVTVVNPDFSVDDDEQCFQGHNFNFVNNGATGGAVTHFWDFGDGNSSTTENPSYTYASAGNYTVRHDVIYAMAGCTASADALIRVFPEPSAVILLNSNVTCVGGSDGELGTFIVGGTAPYSYLWSPNGQTTATISNLTVGNYSLTLTDDNGCSDFVNGTIIQNDSELPNALCQNATVQLNASGVATISATVVNNGSADNCGIASLVVSPNVFSCAGLGPNAVLLTVTDVNGNVSTCNATVTVQDLIPPVPICQDLTVTLDGSGNASITPSQVNNGSTDNCAIQSLSLSDDTFTCADSPSTIVTLTVADAAGNTANCLSTITINENENPTAVCQDIAVDLDATGNVTVTGNQLGSGSTDNCAIADITVNPGSFNCSNIGANAVVVTVTDVSGNTASCNATVTVSDNLAPLAICQNATIQLDAAGNASIVATDVDNGSTDNCGIDNLSVSPNIFDCSDIGLNTVTLTVTDVNGLVSTCDATVTVEDAIGPTATCQDITVALDANGMATIVAAQIDNGSTDNCSGSLTLSVTPNSFDCTVSAPAQVELTVTDIAGNSSTCTATVNLIENTPPSAICQDITVQLDANGTTTIVGADVDGGSSDNCGIVNLTVNPSTFDCGNLGANAVTLTATDASGNSASCSATVTVEDNIDPSAVCQDITVQLDANGTATVVAANVDNGSTDNCSISSFTLTPNSFDCTDLGPNSVTLTVSDVDGNTSTCTAIVTVEDNVPPTALCQDITVSLDVNGNATIIPSQIDNGSSDVCGFANLSLDITAFDCSTTGPNTVELNVEDNSGNISSCSSIVTVLEALDPNAVCQNATVYLDASGSVSLDPMSVDNGSTDNCAIVSFMLSQSDFQCANLGQSIVTLTVIDASGNTGDCIAVVSVLDTISPVINSCPSVIALVPDSADCTPSVTWIEPTESDNCTVTMTGNFSSGDNFPVGTTTVIYNAEDQSGNTASCSFTVTIEPSPIAVTVSSPILACGYNISCNGSDNGVATATVSGGCSPYNFLWSNNQTTQTAVGLSAGEYVLIVTDANGTQATDTIVLTQPEPLSTDSLESPRFVGGTNVSCAGANDGAIDIHINGGAECQNYNFFWTGENGYTSIDEDLTGIVAGTYLVTVTDANGCTHQDSITLTEPEPLSVQSFPNTYNGFNVSCFGSSDGVINVEVSQGNAPYTYQWSNGETTQDIDSLFAGVYSVTVTDQNGCQTAQSITLTEPTLFTIIPTDTTLVSCGGEQNGQFVVQAAGGVPAYSYLWSNGDSDPILNGAGAGTYEVVVTDLNGCQDSLELEMTEPAPLNVAVLQVTNALCFGDDDGSATIEASGGVSPYDYNWISIGQNSQTATELSAGEYIYEVTDANGCTNSDTVEITQPDQIILVTSNDTTICPGTVASLSAEASGGGGTYLITWESGQGFGTTFNSYFTQLTNVSVTAVDQNGCESVPNSVIVSTFAPVVAAFEETIVDACTFPVVVDFANNSTNALSYSWTFGNGDSSTQVLPSTMFDTAQTYTISLVAISPDGCVDSTIQLLPISPLPQAGFAIPNPEGCYPIMVGLFNQSSPVVSYLWDFGDGVTSTQSSPYHFYEEAGSYDVTLIVTDSNGCMDTLTVDSAVFAYPRPDANFTLISTGNEEGSEFTFINNSTGANDYIWSFGNGDLSELVEPTYDYPEHGSYQIILRAYNEYGCLDTATANIYIELVSGLFVPNAVAIGEFGDAGSFLPKGTGIREYHAWVYDKWGNMLWESTELFDGQPSEGWDGRYKGQYVPMGAYVWKINAIFKDGVVWEGMQQSTGKKANTGSVTVLF
ncbi:MAG: choice-of-anchor L domain-containing protein [Flavobacteriales bacterium]|nr:choice-of-anchor L domain-containing protein [Flavobacteriales bacterium]